MSEPKGKGPDKRLVTLRAMLAADCSDLHPRLKHLIHVMALHADNVTGRGLTGQATLGRYMGLSGRTVRRLLLELETLWEAGQSPVGVLREKRWLNSDRYTIVVQPGAALQLPPGPRVVGTTVSTNERSTMSANDRSRLASQAANRVRLTPNEADTVGLQTSEVTLQSEPQRNPPGGNLPSAAASGAPPHAPAENGTTECGDAAGEILSPAAIASARYRARKLEREQRKAGHRV